MKILNEYKRIKVNGKIVAEHIHIIEQHIKRKLTKDEHVHHKNRNRQDNRIVNLQVIDSREHWKLHYDAKDLHRFTKEDCSKGAKIHNIQRRNSSGNGMYTCSKCTKLKPEEEFSKNASKWTGRDSYCKLCKKSYLKKWRRSNGSNSNS